MTSQSTARPISLVRWAREPQWLHASPLLVSPGEWGVRNFRWVWVMKKWPLSRMKFRAQVQKKSVGWVGEFGRFCYAMPNLLFSFS